jgi:hypothetical protein
MALSVIGAGFGRTGTLSLRIALDRLGLGPCYHMLEVFEHPEHIDAWERAAGGAPADWDGLFRGYRSAVDWPACAFYRQLAERYPEAKVVLTLRDSGRWYRSAAETIFPIMTGSPAGDDPVALAQARMAREVIAERTFGGRVDDRGHAIAVYERHAEEVRRTIPPGRLLVYEVAEGWGPLCRFLGLPEPAEPFPRANTTEDFRRMLAARREAGSRPAEAGDQAR